MKGSLLTRIGTNATVFHLVAKYLDRNDVIGMCQVSKDFRWVIGIVEQRTRELKVYCFVSPNVGWFLNLESLNISIAESIPEELYSLASLKTLIIRQSYMSTISNKIGELINLRELQISRITNLEELPSSIGNLTNLTSLNVMHNSLRTIPDSFQNLTNLDTFVFDGNYDLMVPSFVNRRSRRVKGRKAIRTVPHK